MKVDTPIENGRIIRQKIVKALSQSYNQRTKRLRSQQLRYEP